MRILIVLSTIFSFTVCHAHANSEGLKAIHAIVNEPTLPESVRDILEVHAKRSVQALKELEFSHSKNSLSLSDAEEFQKYAEAEKEIINQLINYRNNLVIRYKNIQVPSVIEARLLELGIANEYIRKYKIVDQPELKESSAGLVLPDSVNRDLVFLAEEAHMVAEKAPLEVPREFKKGLVLGGTVSATTLASICAYISTRYWPIFPGDILTFFGIGTTVATGSATTIGWWTIRRRVEWLYKHRSIATVFSNQLRMALFSDLPSFSVKDALEHSIFYARFVQGEVSVDELRIWDCPGILERSVNRIKGLLGRGKRSKQKLLPGKKSE